MQHRTVSPGLLGDLVMFFFFFFFPSCPRRKREPIAVLLPSERGGLFSLHFHLWYLPIVSYRRNKSNSNSISIQCLLPSMIYLCFLFLIHCTAPTHQHFSSQVFGKLCDISQKELYISRDEELQMRMLRHILYSATWTFELSKLKTCQDCEVKKIISLCFSENKVSHTLKQTSTYLSPTLYLPWPPWTLCSQHIGLKLDPKSHFCHLSAHWVTWNLIWRAASEWTDGDCVHPQNTTSTGWTTSKWHDHLYLKGTNSRTYFESSF